MKKIFSIVLVLLFGMTSVSLASVAFTRPSTRFKLTQELYNCNDSMEIVVVTQFGPEAKVADWVTIKTLFSNNIDSFCNNIGLESYETFNSAAWCNYNGQKWYGGWRHYFVDRHDHIVPEGWLAHDHIDNHFLDLGSWCQDEMLIPILVDLGVPLVVDFNGDGMVEINDLMLLIESWGQDDPVVDIWPRSVGDGIVDERDLEFFMSYWGQEAEDRTLMTHWKLDETEGIIAHDSAGENDAHIIGSPAWQPSGGLVDGAIQFDGIDDYIITASVLDPSEGPFSVLAWIKGGAPGQVVISQQDTANWLMADAEGNLMTELKASSRAVKPLQSQINITDGEWHRIGFVWDGSNRTLYVDGNTVAEDTQVNLEGSDSGLYIGCGKVMEAGTFWSGLIDDVRIYNRVVKP
jgi:hypothetical protein